MRQPDWLYDVHCVEGRKALDGGVMLGKWIAQCWMDFKKGGGWKNGRATVSCNSRRLAFCCFRSAAAHWPHYVELQPIQHYSPSSNFNPTSPFSDLIQIQNGP